MPRTRFEGEIEELHRLFLQMGVCTEEMLHAATQALLTQDTAMVAGILSRDDEVDFLEREIEHKAFLLLATQQPVVAADLRMVSTTLKVIGDVERIGDNTVNIAKTARKMLADKVIYRPLFDVPRLQRIASGMLHDTLACYVRHDTALARTVIDADDEADVFYAEVQRELRLLIRGADGSESAANNAVAASYLLFVAHYFERICDHCVSIAERVIYAAEGKEPPLR